MKKNFTKTIFISCMLLSFKGYSQISGAGVTDIDGNVYTSVIINGNEWMSENLRTTKYSNGDLIPVETDNNLWAGLTSGAWANYDNLSSNDAIYGKIYNGYVAMDLRNVCPTGWSVPVKQDFIDLYTDLGGQAVAGEKLKESGTTHWQTGNVSSNSSGFTGLPGGLRAVTTGSWAGINIGGSYWTSDYVSGGPGGGGMWTLYLKFDKDSALINFTSRSVGLSIRCKKNTVTGLNNDLENESFSSYPNPFTNTLFLNNTQNIESVVSIIDISGKVVLEKTINSTNAELNGLDALEPGIYILQVVQGEMNFSYKIVKE